MLECQGNIDNSNFLLLIFSHLGDISVKNFDNSPVFSLHAQQNSCETSVAVFSHALCWSLNCAAAANRWNFFKW